MKIKVLGAIAGTLVLAAVAFSGFSFNTKLTSLHQLTAKGGIPQCVPNNTQDCLSTATGHIYVGYEAQD